MDKWRATGALGRNGSTSAMASTASISPSISPSTMRRRGSRKPTSSNVFWLKLNFTIKAARLQSLKRQKYQHLQEEALLKARELLQNWEDGPVLLTEDLYSRARGERDAQELLNYTPEALALRFSLRNDPDVVDAVKQLWAVDLPRDDLGCIDQRGYAAFFRRVGRSLEPEASARRRRRMERTIREDWVRDSKGEPSMSFACFFDSVFELADLWCDSIDVDEYVAFLRRLLTRVTAVRRSAATSGSDGLSRAGGRVLRPLKQVKVMDKDGSSSSSSSDGGSEPGGIADDEDELPDENDLDGDDDDDNELSSRRQTLEVPLAVPEPPPPGLVGSKALRGSRAKTPPSSASRSSRTGSVQEEQIPTGRRERRPSIISMGALSDDGRVMGLVLERNSSSAKSRTSSAKSDTPLATLRESKAPEEEDNGAVEAMLVAHRSRSARPRTPVLVVDTCISDAGRGSPSPTDKLALSVGHSSSTRQSRPVRGQLFAAASGAPKQGLGHGSVQMDTSSMDVGSPGALSSLGSSLATGGVGLTRGPGALGAGLASAALGRSSALRSSSSNTRHKAEKKPAGIVLDGQVQAAGSSTRLAMQGVASSGQTPGSTLTSRAMKAVGTMSRPLANGNGSKMQQQLLSLPDTGPSSGQVCVSGSGLDGHSSSVAYGRLLPKPTPERPTSGLLPFYSYEEGASPAKRLLPPMLSDGSAVGARVGSGKRMVSGNREAVDFGGNLSVSATYSIGDSQASARSRTTRSSVGHSSSDTTDGGPRPGGASPLWFAVPRKESKAVTPATRRSVVKQQQSSKKETTAVEDVEVAPWESSFDNDHDDDALAKAVPHSDPLQTLQQIATAQTTASCASLGVTSLCGAPPAVKVGVTSSSSAPVLPKCSPEPTTLPHEYHQLVLGSGTIHGRAEASLTSAPPSSPHWWPLNSPTSVLGSPSWRIDGAVPRELALLDDGLEGHALVAPPGSSPRRVLTPLEPKRTRDCGCSDASDLCPRFVGHCEALDVRPVTPSPLVRMEKPRKPRKARDDLNGGYDAEAETEGEATRRRKPGAGSNNNRDDVRREQEGTSYEEDELGSDVEDGDDVTVIVNATRCLVLRPGATDRVAAKREQRNRSVTRSDMMRRRCQYTFGKQPG